MNSLNIGSRTIPLNAVTKSAAILSKRGGGKTYLANVIAEEFAAANVPFVVFDPIDVWWGLRLAADGKGKGLPVVVFGIDPKTSDLPLTKDMGREIARAVVAENVSCVINTFGMPKTQQRFLITEFSDELMRINTTPRHVFLEEAHEFVPQRVFGEIGKCFAAVSALVTMGRNRGIGVTMISQRAATINKDVLTQVDTLFALRNVAPQDRKALKEWVEYHAAEGDFDAFMKSLPTLPTGEGWIWSPEFLNVFERFKTRKRRTYHPDREKMDASFKMPTLDASQVQAFIGKFAEQMKKDEAPVMVAKKGVKIRPEDLAPGKIVKVPDRSIEIALRNEFESQLLAKDAKIRELEGELFNARGIIGAVQRAVGGAPASSASAPASSAAQVWLSKLSGQMRKTFEFFVERAGLVFTTSQVALACGYSTESSGFQGAMATLKRNRLIVEAGRGQYKMNPDL